MAFPGNHSYLTLSGTLRGGPETWSIGIRIIGGGGFGTQEEEEQVLEDFAPVVSGWWTAQATISNLAQLRTLKLNVIDANGKYLHPYTVLWDYPAPITSTAGGSYPNQIALVATLETGRSRGLAHRGRLFLPAPRANVQADGRISTADAQSAANEIAALISLINSDLPYGNAAVMSAVGAGAVNPITEVTVGRVLDTMRSRRTSLDEGRLPAAVTAGT